jgi:PAS domain S-box-containing protein
MNRKIHILHLEDDIADAELIQAMLEESGVSCNVKRVDTSKGFSDALAEGTYDIVLADYRLPMYDGMSALQLVRQKGLDVPFIFVSGVIGEDAAVEALTRGATDYVLKQKLSRLVPAVNRALFEADIERERKKAAEALRASEERFRTVVENSPIIIFSLGRDGVFTSSQGNGLKKLGLQSGEIVGKSIFATYKNNPLLIQNFKRAMAGEAFIGFDEEKGFVFETRWTPVMGKGGEVDRVIGVSVDVTERRQAEIALRESENRLKQINAELKTTVEKLAAANKELESFSYSVAHDLRNPLKVIDSFTDFLIGDYADQLDDEGKVYLEKIKNGTRRMNSIIDDMLVLSKISRQEIEIVEFDLSEMARLTINELLSVVPEHKITVKIQDGLKVRADPRLMSVSLGNLLGNAWKYTQKTEYPLIEFGAFGKDGKRIFFVRDNGVGFDMCQADRLFAPFQRLHSEKEFIGIGLGLAIVERAIRRHGGKIWAEGEVGKGAVFYFTLDEQ